MSASRRLTSRVVLGMIVCGCVPVVAAAVAGRDANLSVDTRTWGRGDPQSDDAVGALLRSRRLLIPVAGITRKDLRDSFVERRGDKPHEALDIAAPRGTRVVATDDGRIVKLFRSLAGGLTIYQNDRDDRIAYYYAHLDAYAPGLREGAAVKRGDLLGFVGSTGNAAADAPHLHFTIYLLPPGRQWWNGTAINPYPFLH